MNTPNLLHASSIFDSLSYSKSDLQVVMRKTYTELIDFVTASGFKTLMLEMSLLQPSERPAFVVSVLMSPKKLAEYGVVPPPGILIQRSAFGDRRPTLFCVKKFLPKEYSNVWQNVNITFDNEFIDSTVARSPEVSWRAPLPVDVQAASMAKGISLEDVRLQ